jgi:hypothetical protein
MMDTITEPAIPFGTATALGETCNAVPVTRYSKVVSGATSPIPTSGGSSHAASNKPTVSRWRLNMERREWLITSTCNHSP